MKENTEKPEACTRCGATDEWMIGIKDNKNKMIGGICFKCIAKEAEKRIINGEGERNEDNNRYFRWLTHNYINYVVKEAHPGERVDQRSLMDAVVRIYPDEKERYCREMEKGRE